MKGNLINLLKNLFYFLHLLQVHKGHLVKSVVKQFCGYTKETCDQFIQDKIDETFKAAKAAQKAAKDHARIQGPFVLSDPPPEPPEKEKYFIFNGEKNKIRFWKDMLPKVCAIMAYTT